MAGDWIKMRSELHDLPRVGRLARVTGLDRFAIVGRLHRMWAWVDTLSEDGRDLPIEGADIDDVVDHAGFADALKSVGWVIGEDGKLTFPNFAEHNGHTAKKRLSDAARQFSRRASTDRPQNVTKKTDAQRTDRGQKSDQEKRREEKRRPEEKDTAPADAGTGAHLAAPFEAWWQSYPVRSGSSRRGDKRAAWREWSRLSDEQRESVPIATARLVASGEFPVDAERFLRPRRGGETPVFETLLEDLTNAPTAKTTGQTHAEQKETLNVPYDSSWMLKANHAG